MINVFGKRIRLFRPRSIWLRKLVQLFFFVLIAFIAVNHTLAESGAGIPFSLLPHFTLCALWRRRHHLSIRNHRDFRTENHESSFILMIIGFC